MSSAQLSLADLADGSPEPDRPDLRGEEPPGVRKLLTAREVADVLRVPRSTIYELSRNRRIPFLKVGRRTLFEAEALRAWIAAQTVPPR